MLIAYITPKKTEMAPKTQSSTGPITEGSATILPIANNTVFYNPAQVFNRDLSVLLLSVFAKSAASASLHILEGLSASGLRSIRYINEVAGLTAITTNDLDSTAVENITKNYLHNNIIPCAETAVYKKIPDTKIVLKITNADAILLMRQSPNVFDVIDLDPYGSASPFLDAAIANVKSGGLLAVTCTDSLVLNGNNTGTCYLRYGGVAVKAPYGHEQALRLVLGAMVTTAARYKRKIKVLASFSIDFYYRVFVRVDDDAQGANESVRDIGVLMQCCNCEAFEMVRLGRPDTPTAQTSSGVAAAATEISQTKTSSGTSKPGRLTPGVSGACRECSGPVAIGGPFYTGSIYDADFLDLAIATVNDRDFDFPYITVWDKIKGLLYGLRDELPDVPLFYSLSALSNSAKLPKNVKLSVFRKQLKLLGYRVSGSHREPASIKTDAPAAVVYDVVRAYAQEIGFVPSEKTHALAKAILAKKAPLEIVEKLDFTAVDDEAGRVVGVYLPNPTKNWGPKPAAKRRKVED